MKLYVSNAFSLSMLDRAQQRGTPRGYTPLHKDAPARVARVPRPVDEPMGFVSLFEMQGYSVVSVVGHADTATVLGRILGRDLPAQRISVKLAPRDILLVGQYIGPRIPEGATTLPKGATIEWWTV